MKASSFLIAALLMSGAAFAQTTEVKPAQVKAGSKTSVNATAGNQQVSGNAATSANIKTGSNGTQASAAHSQEGAVTVDPAVVNTAKSNAQEGAINAANTTMGAVNAHTESAISVVNTANANVQANAAQAQEGAINAANAANAAVNAHTESAVNAANAAVKTHTETAVNAGAATSKAAAARVKGAANVHSAVNNSLKIQAAPVRVQTITTGTLGLKGL